MKKDRAALEHLPDWDELTGAEMRKLQRDGRERKAKLIRNRKKKFGKAGKSKLSTMEEAIMDKDLANKIELAEIEKNLKRHTEKMMRLEHPRDVPKGWKGKMDGNIPRGWKSREKDNIRVENTERVWKRLKENFGF